MADPLPTRCSNQQCQTFPWASVIGRLIVPWSYCPKMPEGFLANLRRSRRGAAPGTSGLTGEMLQLVLGDEEASAPLSRVGARLARAEITEVVVPWIGLGRVGCVALW